MKTALLVACVAVVSAAPAGANADDKANAKAAFDKGTALFHEGQFDDAALAFREAHRLRPNWKLLYNIGQSEAAAKRHGLALQAFEEYLAEGGDEVTTARRSEVAEEIARLRGIVGDISVAAPDGAQIYVDERERGTTPLPGPLPVAAGKLHALRVVLGEEVLVEREIRVRSGKTVTIDLTKHAATPAAPAEEASEEQPAAPEETPVEPAAAEDPNRGLKIGGWVLVGVGGAALIVSAVTGGMALDLDDELAKSCPEQECGPGRHDDVDRLRALSVTSDVMTGVGATALAAGAVMLVVAAVREQPESAEEPVALVPAVGADGLGLVLEGRF